MVMEGTWGELWPLGSQLAAQPSANQPCVRAAGRAERAGHGLWGQPGHKHFLLVTVWGRLRG